MTVSAITVSAIMATTPGREELLRLAVDWFKRQNLTSAELVIAGRDPVDFGHPRIRYIHSASDNCGTKLNAAARVVTGSILHKLDDDDFYRDDLLETSFRLLGNKKAIVFPVSLRLFILATWRIFLIPKWRLGTSMCFPRRMWEERPFREDIHREIDVTFYDEHPHEQVEIEDPGIVTMIRHGIKHLWLRVPNEKNKMVTVEDNFSNGKFRDLGPPEHLLPSPAIEVYRRIVGRPA